MIYRQQYRTFMLTILLGLFIFTLSGCAKSPPDDMENVCHIFQQYPKWYWAAQDSSDQWHVPISVMMAIIYQESHFHAKAAPPREKLLWIIPWKRPTSAYGYSQAVKGTWKKYRKDTNHSWANRSAFGDAVDFIGWFSHKAHQRAGISIRNAEHLYLAYHEGISGYMRHSYRKKHWLVNVARHVQHRANKYRSQLKQCKHSLPKKPWWHFW